MARRGQRQVFVELPPPPAEKWRWTSLSPVKVKNEEVDDVIFLGERTLPRKRQRSEQPDQVQVKIEETAVELKFKEQKVKVEPAAIVLSEDSLVRRRLDRLPQQVFETELTDEEQMHTITRQLFTDHYIGGHNQFTFFNVRGRVFGQRETTMMCANRVMNPYSPRIPGSHGLFMDAGVADDPDSDDEDEKDEKPATKTEDDPSESAAETKEDKKDVDTKGPRPQPRLAVLAHIAPGHWRYVGHYDTLRSEPLTSDEWREQTTKFKTKWTSVIFREMSCFSMRQRVWHRKQLRAQLKRDPTKEEVRKAVEVLSRPDLPGLTHHDIELAFEKGELRIFIKALCFVKYHEKFQRDLIKISANPEPRVKASRPKPKQNPKPKATPKPKPKSKLKRKRDDSDEGEAESEDDDEDYVE